MHTACRLKILFALCTCVLVAACGGGGGGSGSGSDAGFTGAGGRSQPLTDNSVKIQVAGIATFDSISNSSTTGGLDYKSLLQKPVRGASIQAISGSTVIATATTSEQGAYTFNVPAGSTFFIRLRAELVNTQGSATWSIAVKDNTAGNALWAVDDVPQSVGTANISRSISAGSGWSGSSYSGARSAGPFAILDTVYAGLQLVTSAQSAALFPPLTIYWSPNNISTRGSLAIGEIGTTFFSTAPQTSTSANGLVRFIYVLGRQDNDTDEYDSAIIAHEFGHYLESAFGKTNSFGGPHGPLDKLDATLAFSEGWGNAWSGMVRDSAIYADSSGFRQASGKVSILSNSPTDAARGWYREDSVDSTLYRFFLAQGFAPIWSALSGPARTSQDALATIFSFAAAVRSAANAAAISTLNTLLAAQAIFSGTGADQWGTGEVNNGGSLENLPLYIPLALNVSVQTCLSKTNLKDAFPNKLGSIKYYRLPLPSGGMRTISANFSGGRDIDLEVFQKGVTRAKAQSTSSTSETATVNLDAGEAVIRISDFNLAQVPASTPCATLVVN